LRSGQVVAILYGCFGVILLPIMVIAAVADGQELLSALLMAILLRILYPVFGFVIGILSAALYNVAARLGGGLLFESEQVRIEGNRVIRGSDADIAP
jgi:hypothetical protein